jgi:hypothetical protein
VSDTHLPDELSQWPSDPFAVLGVRPGVGPRELRKAYTSLIRAFKPEHWPDHFRRIREAFETVQRIAFYFSPDAGPDAESSAPHPAPRSEARSESSTDDSPPRSRPPLVTLEAHWERAVRGGVDAAYRGLVEELERGPPRPELFARLYWLAVVAPEVDPDRPAADWLTRGMGATGLSGVLLELYESELHDHPGEAASPRAVRQMGGDHPGGELVAFARLRWQALCRVGQWDAIRADYDRVRDTVRADNEVAWLWLASDLITWIAWGRQDPTASTLVRLARKEVRALEHLALRHAAYFDQLDWLDAVAQSCRRLRELDDSTADFRLVLRDSWLLPPELLRRPLTEVLAQISDKPVRWVERFDRAGPEALAALHQFGNLLSRYQADANLDAECPHPPNVVRRLAADALVATKSGAGLLRARALRFCLDEALDPGLIRWAFHPDLGGPEKPPRWVNELADDAALHHVCWACRLFRA